MISGDSPARGYAVIGLTNSIEEVIGPGLPVYVQAVLLPFEGRIIYDSLLIPYAVYFGGGIRSDLSATYRRIQEREGLITALPPEAKDEQPEVVWKRIQASNKKLLGAFQKALGQSGLSPKMIEEHTAAIATFGQDFLSAQKSPHLLIDVSLADVRNYLKANSKTVNPVSLKRFVRFLRDTMRMDYELAEEILEYLKRERRS